jgi:cytoskeleton protein RodZ
VTAPSAPAAGDAPAADADADDARAAAAALIPLAFAFDGESWTEVTDGRGERLAYGLNAAGRTLTVRGEPPFTVVLGNAGSVRLRVDGEPYAIPPARRGDNLVRFSVDIAEE